MLLSLNDPVLQSTFNQVAKRTTRVVKVGAESRTITTPFPSLQDWRDAWIYFLMLDRFNRADGKSPASMPYDKPFGEFQGGTFNGVRERLNYIKDLGAGAIWLSPVLKNRQSDRGTFHGYGIQDFLQPEPRFASAPGKEEDELRALVDEAHALGPNLGKVGLRTNREPRMPSTPFYKVIRRVNGAKRTETSVLLTQ